MFWASMCPSSGELIVSIHLVYVTLYRWPFGVQVWMRLARPGWGGSILPPQPVVLIRFSWWWARGCHKHVENINKHTWKTIVHQVGYLQRLYRNARSTEHKINHLIVWDHMFPSVVKKYHMTDDQYKLFWLTCVVEELLHLHPLLHFHIHIYHQSTDMTSNGVPGLMTDAILFKRNGSII